MTTILPEIPPDFWRCLPQIDESEIRVLWDCEYWDGPRDGVVQYQSQPCWFSICDEASGVRVHREMNGKEAQEWYTRFIIVALTPEQFSSEKAWNELFREKVGTYWDYDESGRRKTDGVFHPEASWHEYYDREQADQKPLDLSTNRVLGWYETIWRKAER